MAGQVPANMSSASKSSNPQKKHKRLSRLPPTHKISKRPLLHPAIPSPRTSAATPKVIYISASSPFIAIIKRVRKLLDHVEDRAAGAIQLTRDGKDTFRKMEKIVSGGGIPGKGSKARPRDEEVQLRATGKAIQKALQVAIRLQSEEGLRVRFETGSVGAVDDVIEREGADRLREKSASHKAKIQNHGDEAEQMSVDQRSQQSSGDVEMVDEGNEHEEERREESEEVNLEKSRIRRVSCFIVYVGLK